MNKALRITILVLLAVSAVGFSWQFKATYDRLMTAGLGGGDTDLINVKIPDYQKKSQVTPLKADYHLGVWGAGMVLSVIGLGVLVAHEISRYFADRTTRALYNDEGEGIARPDYERAEEEWAKGDYLEAIRQMRDCLERDPRAQHIALRIAEIYEKDLQNPLAAALEYEQVLKQKLPAERWGWAAIHLCNLYTGKLNQFEQAVALLRRIDAEYGATAAAEKARARLEQLEADGLIARAAEPPPPEEPPRPSLPPGFAPKKT